MNQPKAAESDANIYEKLDEQLTTDQFDSTHAPYRYDPEYMGAEAYGQLIDDVSGHKAWSDCPSCGNRLHFDVNTRLHACIHQSHAIHVALRGWVDELG